jgi:nitrite reductase/ring-hydroxylating ferredoxin subunit
MTVTTLPRTFFQRLFGRCLTKPPADAGCWSVAEGEVTIDLARAPELARPDGALRLEGDGLPTRLLVVQDPNGEYHAFENHCTHGKRRLDPIPGEGLVQCCSLGRSTFDTQGRSVHGPGKSPIRCHPVTAENGTVRIRL